MTSQLDLQTKPHRPVFPAMLQGLFCRCPNCQKGQLFAGFLAVTQRCKVCNEDFSHQRADDAPPYFTIFIVGHIIIPLVIWAEVAFRPDLWLHMTIWIPVTTLMALTFLRPIKGAIVALQWANYMHGFDPHAEPDFIPQPSE